MSNDPGSPNGAPTQGAAPDPFEQAVTDSLKQLVTLQTQGNDLVRATNYLLMGGRLPGMSGLAGRGGGTSTSDLDRLFASYFGDRPKTVNPEKGLGQYVGRKLGGAWKGSRSRRWGKTASRFGRGAARTLGGGKKTAGLVGSVTGVFGKIAGAALSLIEAFGKVRDAVDKYTEAQFAIAARLSENSGDVARVMADREINQVFRDMNRGSRTAGSYESLQKAESQRKNVENELSIIADNAVNKLLTFGNQVITPILEGLNALLAGLEHVPGIIGKTIKDLRKEEAAPGDTFGDAGRATRDVEMLDDAATRLLDMARRASLDFGSGTSAPGAPRPGGLP